MEVILQGLVVAQESQYLGIQIKSDQFLKKTKPPPN
jgi:hypothetical protein